MPGVWWLCRVPHWARSVLPALPSLLVSPGERVFCWGGCSVHGTDHVHLRLWVLVQGSQGISGEGHGRCCGSCVLVATLF